MIHGITARLICACAAALLFSVALADYAHVDWSSAERLFDGIDLVRLSYDKPRLMKALALRVDLNNIPTSKLNASSAKLINFTESSNLLNVSFLIEFLGSYRQKHRFLLEPMFA